MSAARLRRAVLLALLALAPAAARPSAADAFENRIPPVAGQLYGKAGRFELSPMTQLSLNDAFFSKYLFGARLGYHFSEELGLSGAFAAGPSVATSSTTVCPSNAGCRAATDAELYQVPGHVNWLAGVEVAFSPIYGKLNLFAEQVIHFDLSLLAGADYVAYRRVLDPTTAASTAAAGGSPPSDSALGGHLGLGARVFLSRAVALRLELKDYLYRMPVQGRTDLQSQLLTELGLSFFFGGGR
ncbi:MAG TPA: outer membrane beta-barrel domain-containing protein [Anaeromyxobacteraceae bacterium]|jgi:outer membrane beta-barrel protein|nr:outer membrane beta-barrel domain-containing protein [Anaeromyxobacteraceae bacterium]